MAPVEEAPAAEDDAKALPLLFQNNPDDLEMRQILREQGMARWVFISIFSSLRGKRISGIQNYSDQHGKKSWTILQVIAKNLG